MRLGLSYDDVLIVPNQHSEIASRQDPSTSTRMGNLVLDVPIIGAPMDTVSSAESLAALGELGTFGIMHRYATLEEQALTLKEARRLSPKGLLGFSVGVHEFLDHEPFWDMMELADVVCIDVANGDSAAAVERVGNFRFTFPDIHVMAGNVATSDGFKRVADAGADSIRVGIGPGAGCSTRIMTGIGVPQLTAVQDAVIAAGDFPDVAVIADGGVRVPADLCKALAVGADVVMAGSLFAATAEAPGAIEELDDGTLVKEYRGMASEDAQRSRGTKGRVIAEGVSGHVKYRGTVEDVVQEFIGGLRSSMSYVNARDLAEYYGNTELIRVTQSGIVESSPHDLL